VARESLRIIQDEKLIENAMQGPTSGQVKTIRAVISRKSGAGAPPRFELTPEAGGARRFCEELMKEGLLCKETHENVIRFAPPLIVQQKDLNWAFRRIKQVFKRLH
jgi:ornithine--oxo-acid transaminase